MTGGNTPEALGNQVGDPGLQHSVHLSFHRFSESSPLLCQSKEVLTQLRARFHRVLGSVQRVLTIALRSLPQCQIILVRQP